MSALNQHKISLNDLEEFKTNHINVVKRVCFNASEFQSNITQVEITKLITGQIIEPHKYTSMEEVFYVIEGECLFTINENLIVAKPNDCIKIPGNTLHSLKSNNDCTLFYFGVST